MYEELVERLRAKAEYMEINGFALYATAPFYRECADAIEELSLEYESVAKSLIEAMELVRNREKIHWIPVSEKLPQPYEDVNLKFRGNQAVGFWDGDCWCVYSGDCFYTEVAENEGKPTHWCKKLPEPMEEA